MFRLLLCITLVWGTTSMHASHRTLMDRGWQFVLADSARMAQPSYDDRHWRTLDLPHDWAIEGDFYEHHPSGTVGGALPGGVGWYRKHFEVNNILNNHRYYIDFDGVFMLSSVYLNGHLLGIRPYGFISFRYDLTPYLNRHGDNVIAVRVDNGTQPNCRWYSGCGIYRHVYMVQSSDVHVAHWGIQVQQSWKASNCKLHINVQVSNECGSPRTISLRQQVYDRAGQIVAHATTTQTLAVGETMLNMRHSIAHPHRWSTSDPYLYRLKTQLLCQGQETDCEETTVGLRTAVFDANRGFLLNGVPAKLNGVCMHGDLGCLGTALNEAALYRQLKSMRDMGANAIRCSHNPPAPELLNMCDSMGLLVMNEAFDVWTQGKVKNDYAVYFDQWHERDLRDMVLRDRNHPCIIAWSIGNEVLEQWSNKTKPFSLEKVNIDLNHHEQAKQEEIAKQAERNMALTRELADIVRRYDNTRPITAGCNEVDPTNNLFRSGALDLIGFNYHHRNIKDVPRYFPGKPMVMTESVSALQTRGYYLMPSDSVYIAPNRNRRPYTDPTMMCSAYDNMRTSWGSTHESTWDVVKHTPYCAGQFVWTGWDYIGEPTPFAFPARSSYFGIVDLAGFPKDVYYMYQSEWSCQPVLHLFPHWNWLEGQTIDLWCYYSQADEVELYVNGRSQGVRRKADSHQYHVAWRVKYEPGSVRVVARQHGQVVREQTINTAGAPESVRLTPNKLVLKADEHDLVFFTVEVVDKNGNRCPWAENEVIFDIRGNARIVGVDNGSSTSMERFKANRRKAMMGRCLVVVQAGGMSGRVTLQARSIGLKDAQYSIEMR